MRHQLRTLFIVTSASLGFALGCSSSSSPPCAPGQSIACVGPRGCGGYQVCNSDGKGYAACQCGELPDATSGDGVGIGEGGDAAEASRNADGAGGVGHVDAASGGDATTGDGAGVGEGGGGAGGPNGDGAGGVGQADAAAGGDATIVDAARPQDAQVGDGHSARFRSKNPLDGAPFCDTPSCAPDAVLNGNSCVSSNDPAYGCGRGSGSPCGFAHALPRCDAGACVMLGCDPGWADCDGNPSNGCEADLTSTSTCTACNVACATGQQCLSTGCVSTCTSPNTNCAGTCRNLANDLHACGSCNTSCGAGQACVNGTCTCAPGYASCNGACVDVGYDVAACGTAPPPSPACQPCSSTSSSNPQLGQVYGNGECVAGACTPICFPPYEACTAPGNSFGACINTLADPANCGQCSAPCATGEICITGSCQPLSAIQWISGVAPSRIAQDANNIYWTDPGDDTINAAAKATGQRRILASSNSSAMVIDDAYVYWLEPTSFAIYRVPQAGGSASQVTTLDHSCSTTCNGQASLVVDSTNLYACVFGGSPPDFVKVPKSGGMATAFSSYSSTECVSDGLGFATQGASPKTIYGIDVADGGVNVVVSAPTVGLDMGTITSLMGDSNGGIHWLFDYQGYDALDGTGPFNTSIQTNSLPMRNGMPNAGFVPPLIPDWSNVYATHTMATDCGGLYWTTGGPDIWVYSGYPAQVVTGGKKTTEIVVDNNYLYWTDGGGWVGRMPK